MTNHLLYIDGRLADLGNDTKVTLNYRSNLFRDVTELQSNGSMTINLPKTRRNINILDNANIVGYATRVPYKLLACKYLRNGIEVIRDGRLAVLTIGDTIEVSIMWGMFSAFNLLSSNSYTLNDIKNDLHVEYSPEEDTGIDGVFYLPYNCIRPNNNTEQMRWSEVNVADYKNEELYLSVGSCVVSTTIGASATVTVDKTNKDYKYIIVENLAHNSKLKINNAYIDESHRLYAVMDSDNKLLDVAEVVEIPASPKITYDAEPLGLDTKYYYNSGSHGHVRVVSIEFFAMTGGDVEYGVFGSLGGGSFTAKGGFTAVQGVNTIKCDIELFDWQYVYLKTSKQGILSTSNQGTDKNYLTARDSGGVEVDMAKVLNYNLTYDTAPVSVYYTIPFNASKLVVCIQNGHDTAVTLILPRTSSTGTGTRKTRREHPIVGCVWLLNEIKKSFGVNFVWQDSAKEYIQNMCLPLIKCDADDISYGSAYKANVKQMNGFGTIGLIATQHSNMFNESNDGSKLTVLIPCKVTVAIQLQWQWDSTLYKPNGTSSSRGNTYSLAERYVELTVTHTDKEQDIYTFGEPDEYKMWNSLDSVDNIFYLEKSCYTEISIQLGDTIEIKFKSRKENNPGVKVTGGTITISPLADGEVPLGGSYPVVKNLPDIKVLDFIKFLSVVTGTFPVQKGADDDIIFKPFSALWNNKGIAVDWSKKLIASSLYNTPREQSYNIGSYCRNNYYKWKEDDTVLHNYDGNMEIDNATLDKERTVLTFPFAATDGTYIPLYDYSEEKGNFGGSDVTRPVATVPKYNACKERIMNIVTDENGVKSLAFKMDMKEILKEKYSQITKVISDARVIKERFALSSIDLLEFDETVPVYLAQYGAYFAVIEIQSSDESYSVVTMIKI